VNTLDRYIVKNFLLSVLLCFVALMCIRIVADLFFNMDEFAKSGAEEHKTFLTVVGDIGTYYAYQSLEYFRELAGVIIVTAAAFTLARMNHTNELTAVLASGVSLHRVLLPVLVCAVGLNVLLIVDTELLIPRAKHHLVRSRDDVAGEDAYHVRCVIDEKKSAWYSKRFFPAGGRLVNPLILLRDSGYGYIGHLTGAEAAYDPAENGWVLRSGELPGGRGGFREAMIDIPGLDKAPSAAFVPTRLGPEVIVERARKQEQNRDVDWSKAIYIPRPRMEDERAGLMISASRLDLKPAAGGVVGTVLHDARFVYSRGEKELARIAADEAVYERDAPRPGWRLRGGRLIYRCDLDPAEMALRQSGESLRYMSTAELTRLLRSRQLPDPREAVLIRHGRFAEFFNNLIMLLVAVPFVLSRERNIKSSAAMTVLMVGGLYVFIHLSQYVGLAPSLAAWLPILVFGPVAAVTVDAVKT